MIWRYELKPEKTSFLNGIRTLDLCDTSAVVYQLSYQANWELATVWVRNITVEGVNFATAQRTEMGEGAGGIWGERKKNWLKRGIEAKKMKGRGGVGRKNLIIIGQEPITRSLQLPLISVTAFSQTDLFLVWIYLEFSSPQEPRSARFAANPISEIRNQKSILSLRAF